MRINTGLYGVCTGYVWRMYGVSPKRVTQNILP